MFETEEVPGPGCREPCLSEPGGSSVDVLQAAEPCVVSHPGCFHRMIYFVPQSHLGRTSGRFL